MKPELYPRHIQPLIIEALEDTPVVLIHGPRQSGKTTLAKVVGEPMGFEYFSFDNPALRSSAHEDPVGFVEMLPPRAILDEVQKVPSLFESLKDAVDRGRRPGRFIMTGSANVLLVPRLSDSLAGRMEVLRLRPLAQCEIEKTGGRFLGNLLEGNLPEIHRGRLGVDLARRIVAGGYPEPLGRTSEARRRRWYDNYLETLVERDIRDLANIHGGAELPRLLKALSQRTAQLLNVSDLASPFQLSRPTVQGYAGHLERLFLIETLPAWHPNRGKRLIKTPKTHVSDTGLAASLLGLSQGSLMRDRKLLGHLCETFVHGELRRQAGWAVERTDFYHFRDRDGYEVDLVIESGNGVMGIETKVSGTVSAGDFRGLKRLRKTAGGRFTMGVVLYDGEHLLPFGEGLSAVPISALLS